MSEPWQRSEGSAPRARHAVLDPADALISTLEPMVPAAIDELHVAAVLESRGVTDRSARDEYGHDDVFTLARAVSQRLPSQPDYSQPTTARRLSHKTLWELAHGPLYMLPSAVYPAVFTVLGTAGMVHGLVFATALGWVWGMGMSAVAYQLLGQQKERAAGRMLRLLGMTGLGLALVGATFLSLIGAGGPGMVAFAVAQMGFALASGVLVFYGKELRLGVAMLPACAVGVVHIVAGYPGALVVPTLVAGGLSIVLVLGTAWWTSIRAASQADSRRSVSGHRMLLDAVPSVCYAALCAAFLLFTDTRYVIGQFDLAIAVAPLVLGMGAVEWRAHRFTESAGDLLHRNSCTADFARDVWRLLLRELTICLVVLGGLGGVLLAILRHFGMLTDQGAMLVGAHVLLGGAYFVGFVLARYEQYPWLLGILSFVVVTNIAVVSSVTRDLEPVVRPMIFLLSCSILLVLLLARLYRSAGRVYLYR
ncbi:MAG: hypothetical protein ACRDRU_16940 [Pseudonocardiaceae bacterium]